MDLGLPTPAPARPAPAPAAPSPTASSPNAPPSASFLRGEVLARRVRLLVAATIAYNAVEAVVALTAGHRAGSTALVGFGVDSVIEVSSAVAVAWQFAAPDPARRAAREHRALRVVAVSFVALAVLVGVESARSLLGGDRAEPSGTGVVLAAVSLLVMPFLSAAQRRAGRELGSASAVADSRQTLLCTWLSAVLLVGLVLDAVAGWSWADPVAGLVIAGVALREARAAWRGEGCCAPAGRPLVAPADEAGGSGAECGAGDAPGAAAGCGCGGACCR